MPDEYDRCTPVPEISNGAETLFDQFRDEYEKEVDEAISFSGLKHDFFTRAKAEVLCKLFTAFFHDPGMLRVLDIGCGTAAIHPMIAPSVGEMIGVDVARQLVERASLANPANRYVAYDGEHLPFADNTFDVVFTICVMHHVLPSMWLVFAREMHRVISPGGLGIVMEHNPYNIGTRMVVNRCKFDEDAVLLTSRQTEKLLTDAGFGTLERGFFLLTPFRGRVFQFVERTLSRFPLGAQYYVAARNPA